MIKRQFLQSLIFLTVLFACNREISNATLYLDQSYDLETINQDETYPTYGLELLDKGSYNKALTKEQITEDFQILETTLKNNHPGIYDYHSENDFAQIIKSLKTEINAAKNVLDEYRIVSKLISAVSDAHTYVMNPYYSSILQEELLFPIIPQVNNNQITIDGKRLKSINGYPEKEILKQLQSFANSDGNTIPYKNAFIEMEFPLKYFVFMDDAAIFEVVLENGETKKLKGKSYFKEGLRNTQSKPSFTIDGKQATIKIPTWEDETASPFNSNLEEMAQNSILGKFVKESMEKVMDAQTEHLIIDLTGNIGGKSGPAALLLSYLIAEPFKYYSEIGISSDRFPTKEYISNKELVAFYESEDTKKFINEVEGKYFFKEMLLPKISPQAQAFSGTVEVLIDKYSLSVSTDVVAILKKNREVKITGDEIGGSLEHYCAGNYINLVLPHSGIEVNIPLQRLKY